MYSRTNQLSLRTKEVLDALVHRACVPDCPEGMHFG